MSATSSRPTIDKWLRQLVSRQPHQIIGPDNDPYMLRWFVLPKNPWFKVYVHKFLRSDEERALHDHPWSFVSMILKGEYLEYTPQGPNPHRRTRWSIAHRESTHRHRVALINGFNPDGSYGLQPCWTLVVCGPHVREWGFWCHDWVSDGVQRHLVERFVHWTQWGSAGCGET